MSVEPVPGSTAIAAVGLPYSHLWCEILKKKKTHDTACHHSAGWWDETGEMRGKV